MQESADAQKEGKTSRPRKSHLASTLVISALLGSSSGLGIQRAIDAKIHSLDTYLRDAESHIRSLEHNNELVHELARLRLDMVKPEIASCASTIESTYSPARLELYRRLPTAKDSDVEQFEKTIAGHETLLCSLMQNSKYTPAFKKEIDERINTLGTEDSADEFCKLAALYEKAHKNQRGILKSHDSLLKSIEDCLEKNKDPLLDQVVLILKKHEGCSADYDDALNKQDELKGPVQQSLGVLASLRAKSRKDASYSLHKVLHDLKDTESRKDCPTEWHINRFASIYSLAQIRNTPQAASNNIGRIANALIKEQDKRSVHEQSLVNEYLREREERRTKPDLELFGIVGEAATRGPRALDGFIEHVTRFEGGLEGYLATRSYVADLKAMGDHAEEVNAYLLQLRSLMRKSIADETRMQAAAKQESDTYSARVNRDISFIDTELRRALTKLKAEPSSHQPDNASIREARESLTLFSYAGTAFGTLIGVASLAYLRMTDRLSYLQRALKEKQ